VDMIEVSMKQVITFVRVITMVEVEGESELVTVNLTNVDFMQLSQELREKILERALPEFRDEDHT
jgi:hypothetical protein